MLKFAFIVDCPGQTPETYKGVYENSESYNLIIGTDNMDMALEYALKLVAEGYTLFNLCGAFDDEITAKMQAAAGEGVKIRHADYMPEQLAMVEALEEFTRFGIVIVMRGVEEPVDVVIECDDLYTHAIYVKDQQQANEAAKKLAAEGLHGIELCSWFDREKTMAVMDSVDGACPVGTCGEL